VNEVEIITLLQEAAEAGAQAILGVYSSRPAANYKEDHSPVTVADKASHAAILAILERSGLPILSEEGNEIPFEIRRNWSAFWLIDPLDGTKEYLKGSNEFTINIALIRSGEPIAGIIAQPLSREAVIAAGQKAWKWQMGSLDPMEELRLRSLPQGASDLTVIASKSHFDERSSGFIRKLQQVHAGIHLLQAGSALKFVRLAEGKADLYPRFQPCMEWDTAAGDAILRATGLGIYQADTLEPLKYNKANLLNPPFLAGFRDLIGE